MYCVSLPCIAFKRVERLILETVHYVVLSGARKTSQGQIFPGHFVVAIDKTYHAISHRMAKMACMGWQKWHRV